MKKILLIQTGGTISMEMDAGTDDRPDTGRWSEAIYREIPELSKIAELHLDKLFYADSSDVNRDHWARIITCIQQGYEEYDGFVILHGTDTMAYTASALSFGLQHLGKPVIVTGSQVPMSNIRSDARRNLVNAIEMATFPLNEVAICFNDFIYRGNRATKMSIGDFDAFASPNFPALAEIGLSIEFNIQAPDDDLPLEVFTCFDDGVFLLKVFPNLSPGLLEKLDLSSIRALVVEAFGSGNFPVHGDRSLVPFLEKCIEHDIIIVITSQAAYDAVDLTKYESGRTAERLGALSAGDMTTEAALTKMMYLLGNYSDDDRIKKRFVTNIAGEISV